MVCFVVLGGFGGLGGPWSRNSDSTRNVIARTGWKCRPGLSLQPGVTENLTALKKIQISGPEEFLYSHGNSRGVNSREVRGFFGHNSRPRKFWGAPPGGNSSYRPPGAF